MNTHETKIEMCGRSYHTEISYEFDDGVPLIYKIEMMEEKCKKGGVWYDKDGYFHTGPHFVYFNATDFMDAMQIASFVEEIMAERLATMEEWKAERARARAIDRWLDARANGPYHYTGQVVA